MKYGRSLLTATVVAACLVGFLIWAFLERRGELALERERELPVKPPIRVTSTDRGSVVALDKATLTKSGIRLEPIKETAQFAKMNAYGMVVDVQEFLDWLNGYSGAQVQLEKNRADLEVFHNEYLRLKSLHETSRNISDKSLQAAEGTWRSGKAQTRGAEESVRNLEWTAQQRWGKIIARWLMGRNAAIERLIRQEQVLVQITLPPGTHLPSPPRSIRVKGAADTQIEAVLVSPSPRTDPNIQGSSYYYLALGEKRELLPRMNVEAFLPVGKKMKGVFIPSAAVVWWQGKAWVYLQREENRFERLELTTEHPMRDGWFAPHGFSPTARMVVVTGAQLLLSEELRSQMQTGEGEK